MTRKGPSEGGVHIKACPQRGHALPPVLYREAELYASIGDRRGAARQRVCLQRTLDCAFEGHLACSHRFPDTPATPKQAASLVTSRRAYAPDRNAEMTAPAVLQQLQQRERGIGGGGWRRGVE